jgi:glycerophosphoryl diester phosphodiesterase
LTTIASSRPLRIAHRGDWRRAPENSLAALSTAIDVPGCDGVEFDVRMSADDVPVVIHDETLLRVQARPERVEDLAAAELTGAGIPTLDEVLAAMPRRAFLDIELKVSSSPVFLEVLEAARGDGNGLANAVVSSFDPLTLESIGRKRTGWPRWLNAASLDAVGIGFAGDLGCAGISAQWRSVSERSMHLARSAGLVVAAWTVRRRATFDRLARVGVSAVCVEAAALDG